MSNKVYSFFDLTLETQSLLKMPKDPIKITGPIYWPQPGTGMNIELQSSVDREIKFFLDISESKRISSVLVGIQGDRKSKAQARAASRQMIRIDIADNEALLVHRNPDGTLIRGNHIHLDVPEYGTKFAVPISQQNIVVSSDGSNSIQSLFQSLLKVDTVSNKLYMNYSLGV